MSNVRWGIIGCGDVTEVKSGPALRQARGSELVAVMRRDGAKAADYAARHGVARWYDDGHKLIDDPDVTAVYVATPPDAHEPWALAACAAGKPCYVEKPMARNTAEAQRMVDAFAAAGVPLYVAYYRRALPRFVKAKALIESGAIGTLQRVSYRFANAGMRKREGDTPWRLNLRTAGGGLFLDLGSHALDALDLMLGPLLNVIGTASNRGKAYDVEDTVEMSFTLNGVPGDASWDFIADTSADESVLTGSEGELRFSCFGNDPVRLSRGGVEEAFDLPNPRHVQGPLIQLMVDELNGVPGAPAMPSTGESALRTQHVMDEVLRSFYGDRDDAIFAE